KRAKPSRLPLPRSMRRLLRNKFSGIEDALGIERVLDRTQHFDAKRALFLRDPGQVVFADAVVMADRAAIRDDGVRRGLLDRLPLRDLAIERTWKEVGEIQAGAVRIGVAD